MEAVISQLPDSREYVANYSLAALLKMAYQEEKLTTEISLQGGPRDNYIVQYAKMGEYALAQSVRDNWYDYISKLNTIDETMLDRLSRLLYDINQLGILSLWMNLSFAECWKAESGDVIGVTNKLLEEYDQIGLFLQMIQEKLHEIEGIDISQWSLPEKYKGLRASLHAISDYFEQRFLEDSFEQKSNLSKIAIIELIRKFVTFFDLSIKSLKGSTIYDPEEKVTRWS